MANNIPHIIPHNISAGLLCWINHGNLNQSHCDTVFLCPAAMASKSERRSRKLPGNTSIFCRSPPLIIRQRVARLTPSNFADAVIPKSRGPAVSVVFGRIPDSRMLSIAPVCSGEAANNRFSLSSVFMCSPHIYNSVRAESVYSHTNRCPLGLPV